MEHSLHVAAKHFVEAVAPTSPTAIRKKVKAAIQKAKASGTLDLNEVDEALSDVDLLQDWDVNGDENDGPDVDDSDLDDFSSGDSLGKAIALVKQVRSIYLPRFFSSIDHIFRSESPLRQGSSSKNHANKLAFNPWSYCSGSARDGDLSTSFLIAFCSSEGCVLNNQLFHLLFTVIYIQGTDQFVLLADASESVPNLAHGHTYADFQLTKKDWDRLSVIKDALRVSFSAFVSPSMN